MIKVVPKKTHLKLASLEGDLQLEDGATIEADDHSIVVSGLVLCQGNVVVNGDLKARELVGRFGNCTVNGSLEIIDKIVIREGGLEVSGRARAPKIDVDQGLSVGVALEADTVEVGGILHVKERVEARTINVGGAFECNGHGKIESVIVGGPLSMDGLADFQSIDVGGAVKLAGGRVAGRTDVTRSFESTRPVVLGNVDVGGSLILNGKNEGSEINVGGKIRVEGDLECQRLKVGGRVKVSGSLNGMSAEIGGALEVDRDLRIRNDLKVGTRLQVRGELRAKSLEVAGALDSTQAEIEDSARIGGMISTQNGLRAARIQTASNWEVRGTLVGNEIDLGSNVDAEDVYAEDLQMADGAKARNVFAASIRAGKNCKVTGKIEYTKSADFGQGFDSGTEKPKKVKQLPSFAITKDS